MEINHLDVNGVNLEYSLTGSAAKPVITFVHGYSMNLKQFLEQERYFSNNYRVLLFSMRGHGGSSCPSSPSGNLLLLK